LLKAHQTLKIYGNLANILGISAAPLFRVDNSGNIRNKIFSAILAVVFAIKVSVN